MERNRLSSLMWVDIVQSVGSGYRTKRCDFPSKRDSCFLKVFKLEEWMFHTQKFELKHHLFLLLEIPILQVRDTITLPDSLVFELSIECTSLSLLGLLLVDTPCRLWDWSISVIREVHSCDTLPSVYTSYWSYFSREL